MFNVKRLVYAVSFALSLQSSFVFGDVYSTDTFLMHKLCISNPWNGTNYKGDATSSFPCHYDYAIVHVPTLLAEQSNQVINTKTVVKLEIDPIDFDVFYTNFLDGFEFAFSCLLSLWIISAVGKYVLKLLHFDMKSK